MPNPLAIFNLYRRLNMATDTSYRTHIAIDAPTWVASLGPILAVYQSGTPKGSWLAKQNLQRMAELADLATSAVQTLERIVCDDHVRGDDISQVLADGKRLCNAKPADNTIDHHSSPSPAGEVSAEFGLLAKRLSSLELPLDVCYCARGFYVGTFCDAQPYTRESEEYWQRRELVVDAMRNHTWTQRTAP